MAKTTKITKTKTELVIKIPLLQDSYDCTGEKIGQVHNVVGIIAGDRCTISQLIDLGYKDDVQEGQEIFIYSEYEEDKKEFEKLCIELGIPIWEHPICAYCGKVLYGSFLWGKKGNLCEECSLKGLK
jgi:tRNA(Ile2) C34 agmatinyltransferase TiaS